MHNNRLRLVVMCYGRNHPMDAVALDGTVDSVDNLPVDELPVLF